jgi:hypothetical protein
MRIWEVQKHTILQSWTRTRIRYTAQKEFTALVSKNSTYLTGVQDGRAHVQLPGLRAGPHLCPLCRLLQGSEFCTCFLSVLGELASGSMENLMDKNIEERGFI